MAGVPVLVPALFASNGASPAAGAKIYTYIKGTTTPQTAYVDDGLATPAANPVVANSLAAKVFYLDPAKNYDVVAKTSDDATTLFSATFNVLDNLNGVRSVATYAALTALTTATGLSDNSTYFTYARATEEDGGAGFWRYDSASTATANGGTILAIDGGGAGRFFRLDDKQALGGFAFGMLGDGGTNDAPELQAMIDAAAGRPTELGIGAFSLNAGTTHTTPIVLRGINAGPGPGAAAQFHTYDTELLNNYGNDYAVDVTTIYGGLIEQIKFNTQPASRPMSAGGAIAIKGPTSPDNVTVAGWKIRDIACTHQYDGVYFLMPSYPEVSGAYFDSIVNAAAVYETLSTDEGAGGWFRDSYVFGESGKLTGAGVLTRVGYIHIDDDMIIGEAYGVDISVRDYPAGSIRVVNTNLENQGIAAVRARTVDGEDGSMFIWHGNEISNIVYADNDYIADFLIESYGSVWLDTVSIVNNVHRNLWTNATASYYDIRSGTNVLLANNVITHVSGSNAGVKVVKIGAQVTNAYVTGFVFDQSLHTTPYDLTAEATLFDINNGLTYGQLPVCANGSVAVAADLGGGADVLKRIASSWSRMGDTPPRVVATDAAVSQNVMSHSPNVLHTGTLTADRTMTLESGNAYDGAMMRITRTGAGAFNLSIGGLKNLATNTWCVVIFRLGTGWILYQYGAL
jgi:hypothetical protein